MPCFFFSVRKYPFDGFFPERIQPLVFFGVLQMPLVTLCLPYIGIEPDNVGIDPGCNGISGPLPGWHTSKFHFADSGNSQSIPLVQCRFILIIISTKKARRPASSEAFVFRLFAKCKVNSLQCLMEGKIFPYFHISKTIFSAKR